MPYSSFEELEIWKRACRIAVRLYDLLQNCTDFGLKDQMTRAAVSVASNIAEGAERGSDAEFIRFLHISKGSAAELRTQMYIAFKIGLVNKAAMTEIVDEVVRISKMTHTLIKSLKAKSACLDPT